MTSPSVPRIAVFGATVLILAACADPSVRPNQPSPEGHLAIMGPEPGFRLDAPPEDWIISGGGAERTDSLTLVNRDGMPAVELKSGAERIIAVRRVDAMMLATPFLSWTWHLTNHGPGIHPVRLVVGFHGGAPEDAETAKQGNGLPEHDRAIALVWGDTALRRGALSLPPPDRPYETPIYTVRGGRENTRTWWQEAVDLSELYAKAWPGDDRRRTRISFIGLAAAPTPTVVRGRLSGILLTH